jgi:hypothetical protein
MSTPTVSELTTKGPPLELSISPLLKAGWQAFKETWAVSLIIMVLWWIPYLVIAILAVTGAPNIGVAYLFYYLISPLPLMMLTILYLRRHAKQDVSSIHCIRADMTWGLYFRILIGSLLVGFLVGIGFFLLIIPGVYLAICWIWWSTDLLYKKKAGSFCDDIWTSMSESRNHVIRNWCSVFVFAFVLFLIEWVASITFVGVFIVIPIVIFATTESYLYAVGATQSLGANPPAYPADTANTV